ncbi:MAG: hypothetical protein A4E55_00378 [Pelotomaculum sp. PtaU1.Bin035]|nr:MAG: hypothetical protein A4E55_00378 [Pelotomaculum sp. PtaU1.Bin035]
MKKGFKIMIGATAKGTLEDGTVIEGMIVDFDYPEKGTVSILRHNEDEPVLINRAKCAVIERGYLEGQRVPKGYKRSVPGYFRKETYGGGVICPECGCGNTKRTTPELCTRCNVMEVPDPVKNYTRRVPGHVEIECCGRMLVCSGFTTTCPYCERDYNWNGTLLAPRRFWGEETGEVF